MLSDNYGHIRRLGGSRNSSGEQTRAFAADVILFLRSPVK